MPNTRTPGTPGAALHALPRRSLVILMALVALIGSSLALLPGASEGARSPAKRVAITVKAPACGGCTITAFWVKKGAVGPDNPAKSWQADVVEGKAVFRIPRRYTSGLFFTVPGAIPGVTASFGATPIVAVAYRGRKVGSRVTPEVASRQRFGTGCWAGTRRKRVSLTMRVDLVPHTDVFTQEPGLVPRIYFSRVLKKSGKWKSLSPRGITGTQEEISYCSRKQG